MSGAARQRGRGRAGGEDLLSDTSSRRGGPPRAQSPRAPGGFDGPASRGSASGAGSGAGSQGRRPSNPPSVGSGGRSPTQSQGSFQPSNVPQQQQVRGDPARDQREIPKLTDALKNLDLPASFYNVDERVRFTPVPHIVVVKCLLLHLHHMMMPLLFLSRSRDSKSLLRSLHSGSFLSVTKVPSLPFPSLKSSIMFSACTEGHIDPFCRGCDIECKACCT